MDPNGGPTDPPAGEDRGPCMENTLADLRNKAREFE